MLIYLKASLKIFNFSRAQRFSKPRKKKTSKLGENNGCSLLYRACQIVLLKKESLKNINC